VPASRLCHRLAMSHNRPNHAYSLGLGRKPNTARQVLKLLATKPCPLTWTCKKAGHSKTSVEAAQACTMVV